MSANVGKSVHDIEHLDSHRWHVAGVGTCKLTRLAVAGQRHVT